MPRPPLPPVPVHVEWPSLEYQETTFPLENLRGYSLRERAALWWVSNQSDDLLCLPNCRVERLEYQIRAALRALGPLRGRALLSDEVGLGKTIEAGLVIKELLTRGMVKRFLVLTTPSLVDQWEEELSDKFSLVTATTNHPGIRADPQKFWREQTGIVASLVLNRKSKYPILGYLDSPNSLGRGSTFRSKLLGEFLQTNPQRLTNHRRLHKIEASLTGLRSGRTFPIEIELSSATLSQA